MDPPYFGLGYFGMAPTKHVPYCRPPPERSGSGEGHMRPSDPPQGIPEVRCAVRCAVRCHQQLSLPLRVRRGDGRPPNFCSHYGYHTAWVFCNKLSFLPLSLISINIPNILKFQHHLEGAKEIRRRGSGPSVTEPMTGGPSWLVQGHPAMVRGCFL